MEKIFHIDMGRRYFAPGELKEITGWLADNGFTAIELAIGNDGLRFLPDFLPENLKKAINEANRKYCDCGTNEISEAEMLDILSRCKEKNIKVIPLINTPGHMDAIIGAMEILGLKNVRYKGSATTIDLQNAEAVSFTLDLVTRYIEWFRDRGTEYFNMGCDEYANDVLTSGFGSLVSSADGGYERFIGYANRLAGIIKEAGMKPVMFNDGAYYDSTEPATELDKDIIISYWNTGWPGYTLAPASFVKAHGHAIINTNQNWYYVLGRKTDSKNPMFSDEDSLRNTKEIPLDILPGNERLETIGSMLCLWCDEPLAGYGAEEKKTVLGIIENFGINGANTVK